MAHVLLTCFCLRFLTEQLRSQVVRVQVDIVRDEGVVVHTGRFGFSHVSAKVGVEVAVVVGMNLYVGVI